MSKLTITKAAALYGLTRGAIYDRINAGALTPSINERGHKVVDMADLIRIYGEPNSQSTVQPTQPTAQQNYAQDDTIELYRKMLELSEATRVKAEQREERLFNEITALREEVRELRLALGYTPKSNDSVIAQQPTTQTEQAIQPDYTEVHNTPTPEKTTAGEWSTTQKTEKKKSLFGRLINAVFDEN